MKYSVLSIRSKQHLAHEGESVFVQGSGVKEAEVRVLLVANEGKLHLGKPDLKLDGLKLKISDTPVKDKKVKVSKYKAKSRYRRASGFRAVYTEVLVEKLP